MKVLQKDSIFEIEGADHWYSEGDEWQHQADNIIQLKVEML